ncbi:hypothetical protein DID88_005395 [Monilinia fructigena]|uniref:Uncharacterized protein n=1 Tax=Monilinia fructigena TaxID=38457 RepID=A0A395IZM4_9HELO|nr:hypothetical protein DID88_005395 [Monilinia fructigena]
MSPAKAMYGINPEFSYFGEDADAEGRAPAALERLEKLQAERTKLVEFWNAATQRNNNTNKWKNGQNFISYKNRRKGYTKHKEY